MITDIIKQARELIENNCGQVTVTGQLVTAEHLKMLNFMQRNLDSILDEVERLKAALINIAWGCCPHNNNVERAIRDVARKTLEAK